MSLMIVNGLHAEINTPTALMGDGLHSLPPHNRIAAHVVDEYPACPDVWEHGSDKASSYFVSLEAGRGMWFDFTQNHHHKHHVAVVISVQGINPVTGKPITELRLSQYKKQCPIHNVDFQQDRYCPKCAFKWPAQNYIATTTGESDLWLDGFRNESGEVRQYIISEEQARGIAKQIEDKDPEFKRVWAIGFAFYLSKEPQPTPPAPPARPAMGSIQTLGSVHNWPVGAAGSSMGMPTADLYEAGDTDEAVLESLSFAEKTTTTTNSPESYSKSSLNEDEQKTGRGMSYQQMRALGGVERAMSNTSAKRPVLKRAAGAKFKSSTIGASSCRPPAPVEKVVEKKKLEVGAGARIGQSVGVDPNPMDFWQEEPAGMIYVNFTDPETLRAILDAGRRQDATEGALNGLKVGN